MTPARRAAALAFAAAAAVALAGPAAAERTVVIKGRGWGHGLGMSQYGAYGRALAGHGARRILRHYYSGARVRRADLPGRVRVGLLTGRKGAHLAVAARAEEALLHMKVRGSGRRLLRARAGARVRVRATDTGGMRLYLDGDPVTRRGRHVFGGQRPLVATFARGTLVRIREKGLAYAYGRLLFDTYPGACRGGFCLRAVLRLSMQRYLLGLGEMPASWPAAALRAQAIAARTYAAYTIREHGQRRQPCDCGVYDGTSDQVYIGDAKRTGSGPYWWDWVRAVRATKGRAVVFRRRPIAALYSSSSGGHTENNENVWGGRPLRYLRGVRDRFDGVDANPNFRWREQLPFKKASRRLDRAFGTGRLRRIELVRPFGVSGRVTVAKDGGRGGVRIVGAARTVRVDGWAFRNALGLNDTWFRVSVRRDPSGALQARPRAGSGSAR